MRYFATDRCRAAVSNDIDLVKSALPSADKIRLYPASKFNNVHEVKDDRIEGAGWDLRKVLPTAFSWRVQIHFTNELEAFFQTGKELSYCGIKENGLFFRNDNSCVVFKNASGSLPQERITFQSSYFKAIVSELKEIGLPIMEIAGNGKEEVVRFSLLDDDRVYHYLMPVTEL